MRSHTGLILIQLEECKTSWREGPRTGESLGDSGGRDIRKYWGLRPQYLLIGPPRITPQDSQVSLSTPGLFNTLDIYTKPDVSNPFFKAFPIRTLKTRTFKAFKAYIRPWGGGLGWWGYTPGAPLEPPACD